MLAIARHLRVVGMPGEEKEVVRVESEVEKDDKGYMSKKSEIVGLRSLSISKSFKSRPCQRQA